MSSPVCTRATAHVPVPRLPPPPYHTLSTATADLQQGHQLPACLSTQKRIINTATEWRLVNDTGIVRPDLLCAVLLQAFAVVNRQGGNSVQSFTQAVATAINQGGGAATESYAQAFAQAAAAGGDQRTGLAQATAVAFCEGACPSGGWLGELA